MSVPASLASARPKRSNIPSAAVLGDLDSALPSQREAALAYIQERERREDELTAAARTTSSPAQSTGATSPPSSRPTSPAPALPTSKRPYIEETDDSESDLHVLENARTNPNPKCAYLSISTVILHCSNCKCSKKIAQVDSPPRSRRRKWDPTRRQRANNIF